ncbi:MAG: hypothetical protein KGM91_02435 [Burkholderiales bacterium]|nr:hypothetical protein [Burkholderiales bacterium]
MAASAAPGRAGAWRWLLAAALALPASAWPTTLDQLLHLPLERLLMLRISRRAPTMHNLPAPRPALPNADPRRGPP